MLDFVNDPQFVLEAFQPHYRDARLSDVSDPNVVTDLKDKLDQPGIYLESEVGAAATVEVFKRGNNALTAAVAPGKSRFVARYAAALDANDGEAKDRLDIFRSDLTSFVNAYDFLSQILNFEDVAIEKFALYARALARVIRDKAMYTPIDLSGVELTAYSIHKNSAIELRLSGEGNSIRSPRVAPKSRSTRSSRGCGKPSSN